MSVAKYYFVFNLQDIIVPLPMAVQKYLQKLAVKYLLQDSTIPRLIYKYTKRISSERPIKQ